MSFRYYFPVSLILSFLLSLSMVSSPFCCKEGPGLGAKCWASGICCKVGTDEEYWDPTGCLEVWTEPSVLALTVGKKTPINLYIKTTYADDYQVSYKIAEGNPSLIQVDLTGASLAEGVNPEEIRVLHPRIAVVAANAEGKIVFNVTSLNAPNLYKNTTLRIEESNLPVSLLEFKFPFLVLALFLLVLFFMLTNYRL